MKARPSLGLALFAPLLLAAVVRAEPERSSPPAANPSFPELPAGLPLWPGTPPGSTGDTSAATTHWEHFGTTWYPVITNINVPAILPFLPPPDRATGVAVVICPGGGHQYLAIEHEGYAVGKWLAAHGIAGFVLEYRLARAPGSHYRVDTQSLMDAQRAIRTIRYRARAWRVNPSAVGIIGFSAGGEVAALAATEFDRPVAGSHDAIDAEDCRPDFQGLFYPGLPAAPLVLPARTPAAFLCAASDDQFHLAVPLVRLYLRMEAAGIPAEMHIYGSGGHGFGIREQRKAVYSWMGLFTTWLGERGFLPQAGP